MYSGQNLLFLDVDGPKKTDKEPYDKVEKGSIEITEENLVKLLNHTQQPFCHCYVLAGSLLDLQHVWRNVK